MRTRKRVTLRSQEMKAVKVAICTYLHDNEESDYNYDLDCVRRRILDVWMSELEL